MPLSFDFVPDSRVVAANSHITPCEIAIKPALGYAVLDVDQIQLNDFVWR